MQCGNKENYTTEYLEQQVKAGKLDLLKDDIRVYLVASKHKNPSTAELYKSTIHKEYKTIDEVRSNYLVSNPVSLERKTLSNDGVFDAWDVCFIGPLIGYANHMVFAMILTDCNDHIIAVLQVATGLPAFINGGDIIVTWSNDTDKIFRKDFLIN